MSGPDGHVIGIRIQPETEVADWFTIWFEGEDGRNAVATRSGRAHWTRTVEDALATAAVLTTVTVVAPEVDSICDVAGALHAIATGEPGNEGMVLLCLDLLDDVLQTIGHQADLPGRPVLDGLAVRLIEGEQLAVAVNAVGGRTAVIEPLLSSLGRLLAWSTFAC